MSMLNILPHVTISGEAAGKVYSSLTAAYKGVVAVTHMSQRARTGAFFNAPNLALVRASACSWLLHMLPGEAWRYASIHGFKELAIRVPDLIGLAQMFPRSRFIVSYRKDKKAMGKSQYHAGFKPRCALLSTPCPRASWQRNLELEAANSTRTLHSNIARTGRPVFNLPLEEFSVERFNTLLGFMHITGCNYTSMLQRNSGGYDTLNLLDKQVRERARRRVLNGTCRWDGRGYAASD